MLNFKYFGVQICVGMRATRPTFPQPYGWRRVGFSRPKEQKTKKSKSPNHKSSIPLHINGKIGWIEEIVDMGSGVYLKIQDDKGKVSMVRDELENPRVYGYEVFKKKISKLS